MDDTKPLPWRGQKLNAKTILMLQSAERKLGFRLALFQGSFCPGCVPDSGHTHDRGGVFDAKPPNNTQVIRTLRKAGFAAYARHKPTFTTEHTHAVSLFDRRCTRRQGTRSRTTGTAETHSVHTPETTIPAPK